MIKVHILSEPPVNQNTRAFFAPIIWNRQRLLERGISVRFFYTPEAAIVDCDVLAINGKYWSGPWQDRRSEALDWLNGIREKVDRLLFFDRSSTVGHVLVDLLPLVDGYLKNMLFKNRSHYLTPLYGTRLFSDYYHRELGIEDDPVNYSTTVADAALLDKLDVSWNTGLANYSMIGPRMSSWYAKVPLRAFFAPPFSYRSPQAHRPIDISCRMGVTYKYETLAYQRKETVRRLAHHHRSDRVNKRAYFAELNHSKLVASPFGTSEINYRDFEVFVGGALLIKPDMSHLETYPDYYQDDRTVLMHKWDFSDFDEKIDAALASSSYRWDIAARAQELYRSHVDSEEGRAAFVTRFENIIKGSLVTIKGVPQ